MKTAKYFVHTWTLYEVSRIEAWTTADITWHSLSKTNFNTLSLSTAFSLFLVSFVWPSTYRAQYIIDSAIIAATARKYVFSLYLAGHMTRLSDPIIVKPEEKILCVAFLYNHSYIETFNQILSFCEIVTKDIIRIVTFSEQTV